LVIYRQNWGEERVWFHDAKGQLISLPAVWTSVVVEDAFVAVSAGRAMFRVVELLELARLIEGLETKGRSVKEMSSITVKRMMSGRVRSSEAGVAWLNSNNG
jgi:hypothetical protein